MNKKGFTLIELLAVIVILAVIALIASPIILGIIEDSREAARVRSVEAYADAIQTTVTTYMTTSADVGSISICRTTGDSGVIDASPEAKEGTLSCSGAKKAVTYSGSTVQCQAIEYVATSGDVKLTKCQVGNYTDKTYSGSVNAGFEVDAAAVTP